jgi:hypothetical protein
MVSDGTGPEVGLIAGAVPLVMPFVGTDGVADEAVLDDEGAAFLWVEAAFGVGGAVATAGVAARATPAGLALHPPAVPQPGAGACVLVVLVVGPVAELAEWVPPAR